LAACGFLLIAVFVPIRMLSFEDSGLGHAAALWVAAVFAFIGAAVALENGLRAKRGGEA
jgi:hypothetical protein